MTPEQRQAWLAERRTGIGGSDAAAAVGLSKWTTRLELFLDKRGELEKAESEPMLWGNLLEPVIRQRYCDVTGRTVVIPPGIIRHPKVQFALMTPDGIADESRVLQVKTARTAEGWGEPGSAEIPQDYLLQVNHEMFVTGLEVADVAVLVGGSDFRIYVVEADTELQTMLIEQERQFWAMVQTNEPPAPMNRDDVKKRWRFSSGAAVAADTAVIKAAEMLAAAKRMQKMAEERADELTAYIQERMRDAAELADGVDIIATWKNVNASPRFDSDRFKAENPKLWAQYLREPTASRRFLLKRLPSIERERFRISAEALVAMGGILGAKSESGSMYFDFAGGLTVRVSDHAPNEATAKWMERREVASVRVDEESWRADLESVVGPELCLSAIKGERVSCPLQLPNVPIPPKLEQALAAS